MVSTLAKPVLPTTEGAEPGRETNRPLPGGMEGSRQRQDELVRTLAGLLIRQVTSLRLAVAEGQDE